MNRRTFLRAGATAPFFIGKGRAAVGPNILLLLSDDQRFDTIRALGNSGIQTPALDRMVKNGTVFTNAFVANPICTPSRACILTGHNDFSTRVRWFNEDIRPDLPLWPEVMQANGYQTFFTGKWHNNGTPAERGFDVVRRLFPKGMGEHTMQFDEGSGRTVEGYSSELFAGAFIDYLKSGPSQPFFAMVNFTAPHDPRTSPRGWENKYDPARIHLPRNFMPQHPFDNGELEIRDEKLLPLPRTEEAVRKELAAYYAMISHMDEQIGLIRTALEASGMADNTLVAFTSDNGLALGSHGLLGKMSMYDHSVRVPLILEGPDIRKGQKLDGMVYNYGLFATFCELARVKMPTDVAPGSLVPVLNRKTDGVETVFASYRDVQRMVRTQDWKLIWYPKAARFQLFKISDDPNELRDLAGVSQHKRTMDGLRARMQEHMKEVGDPIKADLSQL